MPDGQAVLPEVAGQRPAGQRLARVPLALALVQQPVGGEAPRRGARSRSVAYRRLVGPIASTLHSGASRLASAMKVGSPPIVSRTSPARSAASTVRPEREDLAPRLFGVRQRDARGLVHPLDGHRDREGLGDLVVFLRLGPGEAPRDRGGRLRVGGAGERNVSFAGHEAARRVEADPARPDEEDLGPGVEIGRVALDPGGPAQRLLVGAKLDRVPGHEARGEPQLPEDVDQQPGEVAAGAVAAHERLLGRKHARLHPDVVADRLLDEAVQVDEHVDHASPRAGLRARGLDEGRELGTERSGAQVRLEVSLAAPADRRRESAPPPPPGRSRTG